MKEAKRGTIEPGSRCGHRDNNAKRHFRFEPGLWDLLVGLYFCFSPKCGNRNDNTKHDNECSPMTDGLRVRTPACYALRSLESQRAHALIGTTQRVVTH